MSDNTTTPKAGQGAGRPARTWKNGLQTLMNEVNQAAGEAARAGNTTDEERMRALIDTLSSYIEYFHGGAVELVAFDGETLRVKLSGACLGCPLSPATLHGWVEGTVRQFFPQLKQVESVESGGGT